MRLFTAAPFFLELPTLTIVWFLQYESYFFSFSLFDVFHRKCLKIQPKTEAQKTTGKTCQGGPKIIPKCLKISRFCVWKCHLAPKQQCFAELSFSHFFCFHFFDIFGGFQAHLGSQDRKDGGLFWATFLLLFGFFFGFDFCCNFGRFFLPKATKNVEKNDEKTSLTTNLATSSYHEPHHQRLTNEASRVDLTYPWYPHPPFQVNGRAVVPALPVQFLKFFYYY